MSLITVQELTYKKAYPEKLLGYAIDMPQTEYDTYALGLHGWVLGKEQAVKTVIVTDTLGREYARMSLNTPRPDVASHYSDVPHAQQCGFYGTVNLLGLPLDVVLRIEALLVPGIRLELATLKIQRSPMPVTGNTLLQPIIVNSIGRTGTTWLMRLLSEHPRVAAYRHYPFEGRIASYWIHNLLKTHEQEPTNVSAAPLYTINRDWMNLQLCRHSAGLQWFRKSYLEQLSAFCKQSIEQCFLALAVAEGHAFQSDNEAASPEPFYFAEKFGPGYMPGLLWELYSGAREIVLVRDFRDMHCSIKSFTDKRGGAEAFGVNSKDGESGFVEHTAKRIEMLVKDWEQRKDKIYLLHYEDLILEPEKTLADLLSYLKLDNSPAVIQRLLKDASKDNNNSLMEGHRTSSDIKSSVGRWRKELSREQQNLLHDKFGEYLTLFGYSE